MLDAKIIFGTRKPKSVCDLLICSDFKLNARQVLYIPRCNRILTCCHCPRFNKSGKITSHSTGRKYKIARKIFCNTTNVIYCLECSICQKQYVGQTKNKILIRINQHYNDIKHEAETPVARHWNLHTKSPPDFILHILQILHMDKLDNRLRWENIWMSRLYTQIPNGLNIRD